MAKFNLNFYSGEDKYSDGDIENKIVELIKKYPNDYEKALTEDSSWPVFYHLSEIRKNVIKWYPFKKNSSILEVGGGMGVITNELCQKCSNVTTLELSKKRATAILERNKECNNLEIIVGNFKDINLTQKYDYILLNGVLEYGALYMDSDNPYEDFINNLKKNLKKDGKILIAIENRFGLKYWCGANEDHTNIPYDGLNNYQSSKDIKTFNKYELESLARNCNMNINFYYMFPDYKFSQVIYTDKSLSKNIFVNYLPYYSNKMNLNIHEALIYKDIYGNKQIPFFANSYFIELSNDKTDVEVEFVKFNDFRNNEHNLYTVCKNNKYYKYPSNEEANEFLNRYINSADELKKLGFDVIDINHNEDGYYTNEIIAKDFLSLIIENYKEKGYKSLVSNIKKYDKFIKEKIKYISIKDDNNIFKKYSVNIEKEKQEKLHFVEKLYIDVIPQNMLITDKGMVLIDQEWFFKNAPYEFLIYRTIFSIAQNLGDSTLIEKLLKDFNIENYEEEFEKLENNFQESIKSQFFKYYSQYTSYDTNQDKLAEKENEIARLNNEIEVLKNSYSQVNSEYNKIINSKRWKLINKTMRALKK